MRFHWGAVYAIGFSSVFLIALVCASLADRLGATSFILESGDFGRGSLIRRSGLWQLL